MLPGSNWRADAIVRLLISIFTCIYAGSLAGPLMHGLHQQTPPRGLFLVIAGGFASLMATLVLIRLQLTRENLARRLGLTMVFFYAGMLLGAWAHKISGEDETSVLRMVISALSFQGAAVVLIALFLREHRVSWAEGFGLLDRPGRAALIGLAIGVAFLPVGWMLQMGSAEILQHLPWLRIKPVEQQSVQTLRLASGAAHRIVLAITTIVLAPFAEELLFRGVLYTWIKRGGFPRMAIWGLSLLFAAIHMNGVTFIPLFVLSVILTFLYERTGNILAPMFAHAGFNAANFGLLYMMQQAKNYSM